MELEQRLRDMERSRENYWLRYPSTSPIKLRWRALTVRHCFHTLPGESILELGAGSGIWTAHLSSALRGQNPITAAVFSGDLFTRATERKLPNTEAVLTQDLTEDYLADSFDYVVGTGILCHDLYSQNLQAIYRLLKPGGQFLFFEANYWNPQGFSEEHHPSVRTLDGECLMPDRTTQISATTDGISPRLHSHQCDTVRHYSSFDSWCPHPCSPISCVHTGARTHYSRSLRHALYKREKAWRRGATPSPSESGASFYAFPIHFGRAALP
jgi:SAM-dependent methyltransferase